MIIGFVKGQQFSKKQPVIVSNSINYLEARFVFQTSDWSELVKFAHFKSGDSVYDFLLDGDTIPKEAQLNLYAGNWEVYIHGDRYVVDDDGNEKIVERITTNTQTVQVVKYEQSGSVLPEVGTSVAEQIAAVADNAKKIATSVRNEADAGAFDGKDGYTPVKGVDYFDGNDGVSVTHEWKGTVLEVTSASGTSSVDLKGEKGDRGTTGPQGEHGNSFYKSINNIYGANAEVLEKDISTASRKVQYGDLVLSPNGSVYTVRAINGDTVSLHDGGFSLKGPAGSDYNLTNADKTEIAGMVADLVDVPVPDWNASEGEPGHVLNRTHYTEPGIDPTFDGNLDGREYFTMNYGVAGIYYVKVSDRVLTREDLIGETIVGEASGQTMDTVITENDLHDPGITGAIAILADGVPALISNSQEFTAGNGETVPVGTWFGYLPDGFCVKSISCLTAEETVHKLDPKFLPDGVPFIQTATPGQMLLVKAVDENGKPTEWETVDPIPSFDLTAMGVPDLPLGESLQIDLDDTSALRQALDAGPVKLKYSMSVGGMSIPVSAIATALNANGEYSISEIVSMGGTVCHVAISFNANVFRFNTTVLATGTT